MSRSTRGAPLMKSSADPVGMSSEATTTPDLSVCELNSNWRRMAKLAMLAVERLSGLRGKIKVLLSCNSTRVLTKSCRVGQCRPVGMSLQTMREIRGFRVSVLASAGREAQPSPTQHQPKPSPAQPSPAQPYASPTAQFLQNRICSHITV